ncbi:MAG: HPF/RaiA family ribosome-associated protein [Actinomycetota bacterium]
MQIPLQITFHGIDHSEAVETRIREKVAKLEQLCDRITSCRVAVESHHRNTSNLHHKGEPFHIRIDVTLPGGELVVKRDPKESHINEDIYVALRDAFGAMERQVKEYVARQRGDVKAHAARCPVRPPRFSPGRPTVIKIFDRSHANR